MPTARSDPRAKRTVLFLICVEALTIISFIFAVLALSTGTTSALRKDAAILTVSKKKKKRADISKAGIDLFL